MSTIRWATGLALAQAAGAATAGTAAELLSAWDKAARQHDSRFAGFSAPRGQQGAAGPGESVQGHPVTRVTATRWFGRRHEEVGAEVWNRPAVRSRANCGACHAGAGNGDFRESAVRVPK